MHLRYRGHISKGKGGEKKGKRKRPLLPLDITPSRRQAMLAYRTLYSDIFLSVVMDMRCTNRAIENVVNCSPGVTFPINIRYRIINIFCINFFFLSKTWGSRKNHRSAANEHSVSALCVGLSVVVYPRYRTSSCANSARPGLQIRN